MDRKVIMKRKLNNVLITGGCGFIGCNFIHYLLGESSSGLECFKDSNFKGRVINVDFLPYAENAKSLEDIKKSTAVQLEKKTAAIFLKKLTSAIALR